MKRTWTIIGVVDVPVSFKWYRALFGQTSTRPTHDYFAQILDSDETVLLCLHEVGRPRASVVDGSRSRDSRQRAPLVLRCR
jgi:hypothetical protein